MREHAGARPALPAERVVIGEVERAAAATWPASTRHRVDGWLLRHCELLDRKRSNSALPPPEGASGSGALYRVESFCSERGARPVVQVSPAHRHGELDDLLARRGYRATGHTDVLVADAAEVARRAAPRQPVEVRFETGPNPSWLDASVAAGQAPEPGLRLVPQPTRFLVAELSGAAAGVGVPVVSGGWCGICCMATAPGWRRLGVARDPAGGRGMGARARCAADVPAGRGP